MRILIADGDEIVRNELKMLLSSEGFEVHSVSDGISAIKHFRRHDYNMAILEAHLPELNGTIVARQMRKIVDVPFIILSSDSDECSILNAFALGAEDCVLKPFSAKQLVAKVKAILRRTSGQSKLPEKSIVYDGLHIDTVSHKVFIEDTQVFLTPKEYDLLLFLAKNPNMAFSREKLLNEIWGQDYIGTDRTVDTHVKTLREALKSQHHHISTVRGFGYMFNG
jgi:two-component system response regulator ResD